jgi:hypothetical protein
MAGLAAAASTAKAAPATPAGGKASKEPKVTKKPTEAMSAKLQEELANVLEDLTFDPLTGKLRGPVGAEAIRVSTELAGKLGRLGFKDAEKRLRELIKAGVKMVPSPPPSQQAPLPGVDPTLVEKINRAISLERDVAKLIPLLTALSKLPKSAERDALLDLLKSTILQLKAKAEIDDALAKTEEIVSPGQPTSTKPPATKAPVTPPNATVPPAATPASPTGGLPVVVPEAAAPSKTVVDVKKGDGLSKILSRIGISPTNENMIAFRDINIPQSADGKKRIKGTLAEGGFKSPTGLQPGDKLFVPQHLVPAGTPSVPAVPAAVATAPSPGTPKTPIQLAAEAMVLHLVNLQNNAGGNVKAVKGKEDRVLIARFQQLLGGTVDSKPGPGTLLAAAMNGQSVLPLVMYWPTGATASRVLQYRADLQNLANQTSDPSRRAALLASAARERGQAGIVGQMPA